MVTMLVASGSSTAQSVRKWSLIFVGILLAVQSVAPVQSADRHLSTDREGQVTDILSRLESLDGHFIENRGQVADGILFYSLGNPAVALREDGILFVLTEREEGEVNRAGHSIAGSLGWSALSSSTVRSYAYLVRFEGANKVLPVGRDGLKFNSNFFAGKNPHFWVTDVPNYRRVAYEGIYDGIDLVLSLSHGGVKYEFLAHPGAEVAAIRMAYDGIVSLRLDGGELTTETAAGEIRDSVPYSYQGEADEVGCNYVIREVATYGFACEAFDASRTLVIDPLVYSTYIGGSGWEHAQDVFVDSLDNAFIIGRTSSLDLPVTPGAFNTTAGSGVYVAKLNAAGDSLLYSTYLYGGIANIEGYSITVDSSGNAYITGEATGRLPVTPGAFDETYNGGFCDAFVTKLNATGSSLIYSTFIGGSDWEYGKSIAIDLDGNAYVAGSTASGNFPTTAGVWQRTLNFVDAFVTKLSADGSALLYSTLLGGDGADEAKALALDAAGNAYVTGTTDSDNLVFFPMGYDWTYNGGNDAYIAKFNANASTIEYFTYLGGTGYEVGTAIAVTPGGDVLLGGLSYSHDFGMGGFHFDPDMTGPDDGFVLKLNITAHMMVFGTFIGGASWDNVASIAVDPWGNVLVTGTTESPDFPTTAGSIDTSYNGMQDAYVMRLNASEGALMYSTYLGGTGEDVSYSVSVDGMGDAYAVGYTNSTDFPTPPGSLDTTYNGGWDAFVTKLIPVGVFDLPDFMIQSAEIGFDPVEPVVAGTLVDIAAVVHNIGGDNGSNVAVRFYDGIPPGATRIGADQTIPFIPYFTAGVASVQWTAGPPGMHTICVAADPDNVVRETDEGNNQACASFVVLAKPDYTPVNPTPPGAMILGVSKQVTLTISVFNAGESMSNRTATLAFYNASTPSAPFATRNVAPIPPAAVSGPFTVSWLSPASPGTYTVVADVDHMGSVDESDETNNTYTWTFNVVGGPNTTLVVGAPRYDSIVMFINSSTPVSFLAADNSGAGIRRTMYRLRGGVWINYTSTRTIALGGEGSYSLEWYSEDFIGNIEGISATTLVVDDSPPTTVIGCPSICEVSGEYEPNTHFRLYAFDEGGPESSGIGRIEYRIGDGDWTLFTVDFTLPAGTHIIHFRSVDNVGNVEPEKSVEVISKAEANSKPVVAVIFAIILIVAGVWSSRRRPWKGGKDGIAVVKALAITSLPFVLAEVGTGVISLTTGQLSVPPLVGTGMLTDSALLAVGLLVALKRSLGREPAPEPPTAETEGNA